MSEGNQHPKPLDGAGSPVSDCSALVSEHEKLLKAALQNIKTFEEIAKDLNRLYRLAVYDHGRACRAYDVACMARGMLDKLGEKVPFRDRPETLLQNKEI